MSAFSAAAFFVSLAVSVPAAGSELAPAPAEVRAAMAYVGLARGTRAPEIAIVSEKEMARLSANVPYVRMMHAEAVGIYRFGLHRIFLRNDWRGNGGMLDLVHEMRHYAQDVKPIDTSRVGGPECDAYETEEEYGYRHGYPALEIWRIVNIQKTLACPIIFVPYGMPRPL